MNKIQLCDKKTCTQCMACVNICPQSCIRMEDAGEGFFVPSIDESKCVKCRQCTRVCHQLNNVLEYLTPIKTLACWTKIDSDRRKSSSGGAFSVIARKVLKEQGVVYGAIMDKDLQVRHTFIDNANDLYLMQGSKYVQSYLGETFANVRKHLNAGRLVLFSGTPCQIGGLRNYLHRDYDNLYTCDVVCHGVPSQKAFDVYIDKIGLRDKCEKFNFRFTEGWGFQLSKQLAAPTNGEDSSKQLICPNKAYYLRAFTKGLMFSEACYTCAYARPERVSDVTLADYWGLGVMKPFNHPTHRGISLLLVNTEKALSLLKECSDLFFEERPFEEAVKGNHNLSHTSGRPNGRDTYYEDAKTMSIPELSAKYGIKASVRDYLRLLKQQINKFR